MQFAIGHYVCGALADPREVAQLARVAEEAGWDGYFLCDHLGIEGGRYGPVGDPWVALTAAALATKRLKLGTAVTPLPRRRPHVLAHTLASLDVASEGRMVLGVGIGGGIPEFTAFGEPGDARIRASMLDEGLEVLTKLWSGEPFSFDGDHYMVRDVALGALPVQRPRIPIWVGGTEGRRVSRDHPVLRRAARWDGFIVGGSEPAERLREKADAIRSHRTVPGPFDVVMGSRRKPDEPTARAYEEAGVTWWWLVVDPSEQGRAQTFTSVAGGPRG